MRPRPDAAENAAVACAQTDADQASMRPRPDAAENLLAADAAGEVAASGFNEAAARCRGKL